jgi:4-hydroxy-3-polyprenylbenzoate decarboxylase
MSNSELSREEALKNLRSTLDWLGNDVRYLNAAVDPVLEATAINKAFDDGPAFVAENVTGYPDARLIASLWGRRDRLHRMMGVETPNEAARKVIHAVNNPITPKEVVKAPCQEVVNIGLAANPYTTLPMVQHTEMDGGRFFGSGVHMLSGQYADGLSQLSFYRMSFRGRDHASINMVPGGHGDQIANEFYDEKIPCTINISPPPMVELMGAGSLNPVIFPTAIDEVGAAGALQGSPVEIVKAKTVDAYAIAHSEFVVEGYIVPSERVWETADAEQMGVQGQAPFHPEWVGYMGRAYRSRKFEVTAITRRADKPYYYVPRFGSIWEWIPFISAGFLELANRIAPGLVQDVTTLTGTTIWGGVIFQVKKRRLSDEGMQRNILSAALGMARGLRIAVVVDEDVDIYQPEEVLWAITTRANMSADMIFGAAGGKGLAFQPAERVSAGPAVSQSTGGVAIDATVPLADKAHFTRAKYPVDDVDFSKWFSEDEITEMQNRQSEYFRYKAKTGYV